MRFAAAFVLVLCGCAAHLPPPPETISWSRNLAGGVYLWRAQFESVYHTDPVILSVHGGDNGGKWTFRRDDGRLIDAESAVAAIHAVCGARPLLVLSCNPGGYRLHTPNVVYALRDVWSIPLPWSTDDDCVGNIRDFVTTGK